MTKFILVIILNSIPQSIQVFDNREQCSLTAQLIRKTEHLQSYCVPTGTPIVAEAIRNEITG